LITPFGYDSLDASLIGVFCISFGLFGSIAGATILKKTRKYLAILFVGSICGGIAFFIELALLSQETTWYKWSGFIIGGVSGFFAYPVFSTTLEFGCEIAFPVGEVSSFKRKIPFIHSLVYSFLGKFSWVFDGRSLGFRFRVEFDHDSSA